MKAKQIIKDKRQNSNKTQNTKFKAQTFNKFSTYANWDLFVIYYLIFDFSPLSMWYKFKRLAQPVFLSSLTLFSIWGCSYSFTGSSVPKHLKSIYIPFCVDRSGSGEPNMADDFTTSLIDQFISDNSLSVSDNRQNSDAMLECTINSVPDAPTVIEGGENVSKRRVTINARVVYKDFVMKKTVFDKSFSNFADYINSGDVRSNKLEAIQNAIELITEDILLAVVSDW
jgi:hypothetical protein